MCDVCIHSESHTGIFSSPKIWLIDFSDSHTFPLKLLFFHPSVFKIYSKFAHWVLLLASHLEETKFFALSHSAEHLGVGHGFKAVSVNQTHSFRNNHKFNQMEMSCEGKLIRRSKQRKQVPNHSHYVASNPPTPSSNEQNKTRPSS